VKEAEQQQQEHVPLPENAEVHDPVENGNKANFEKAHPETTGY